MLENLKDAYVKSKEAFAEVKKLMNERELQNMEKEQKIREARIEQEIRDKEVELHYLENKNYDYFISMLNSNEQKNRMMLEEYYR